MAGELEQMEARMSQGEAVNIDSFGRAASHLRRILEALGLERRARDVTKSALAELLEIEAEASLIGPWAASAARTSVSAQMLLVSRF